MPADLPPNVCAFLANHVDSFGELRVLLVLVEGDAHWWDAQAMATQVGVSGPDARRMLDALASRNLLDMRITDEVHYQLKPGTPALEEGVHALAEAYRRSPSAVFGWAAGRTRRSLSDFADAFRFRR